MKRIRDKKVKEQEESLAIDISTTVRKVDEQGNPIYQQVLINPAFIMLQASDAVLEMLKQRPLAMLNLIQSHPTMSSFWGQFPRLWLTLLHRVIEVAYGQRMANLYPFLVYAYQDTLKKLPFIEGSWIKQLLMARNEERQFYITIKRDAPIASVISQWPLVSYPMERDVAMTIKGQEPVSLVVYNQLSTMYVKLLYLLRRVIAVLSLELTGSVGFLTSDNQRYVYALFFTLEDLFVELLEWWPGTFRDGRIDDLFLYFASEALYFGEIPPTLKHQTNDVLKTIVLGFTKQLTPFYTTPLSVPGFVNLFLSSVDGNDFLVSKIPEKQGVSFGLIKEHMLTLLDYLEKHPNQEDESVEVFVPLTEDTLKPYKEKAFAGTAIYNTPESQKSLLLRELRALEKTRGKPALIRDLGSHYARGLTHCANCASTSVQKADSSLSIAFCHHQCLKAYYETHHIDLSGIV